ncbi:histidine phosphatase family protein [Lachnoclostridium phytofermentans]|uniref:Phosphoglycerate mutase n=1 Tax=Lachnoclostridium phytofermentans (strain ATCC 700394 / DSM 18823 / ISDg) TaxID=357809 RepID=A9KSK5_LACP7|nr:histidine phosphatase family protein [Lachnoclostridium phytofermentans]ABX43657.1 Phosphoglycerate mutase [Lachnoclostridium phytofermentans ISDg]
MIILLLRHGESEGDLMDVHEGRADFPLTDRGREQAGKAAKWISKNYSVNRIYSSTLLRAEETASLVSMETKVPIELREGLMEFNNGKLAGIDREEAKRKYPEIPDLPIHESRYEMESKLEFRFRAEAILSEIISNNKEQEVVVVISHGGMINQLLLAYEKQPIESEIWHATGDTGIHCLRYENGKRGILYLNNTKHLEIV